MKASDDTSQYHLAACTVQNSGLSSAGGGPTDACTVVESCVRWVNVGGGGTVQRLGRTQHSRLTRVGKLSPRGSPLPGLGRDAMFGVDLLMECDVRAGRVPALRSQKWEVWQWSLTWSK